MSRIADRFGRAAATYDTSTPIQRQVAAALAQRVVALDLPPGARVAEFGAGTGYLAKALWPRLEPSLWIATDLAPAMAAASARALPPGGLAAVMDAARPALAPGFDLVCSSLTLQWVEDPAAAIRAWRGLGGALAVATLVEGSFAEWRGALARAGAAEPEPRFPPEDAARAWFGRDADIEVLTLTDRHAGGVDFARAARRAGIDAGAARSLNAGVMRRALRAFEAGGASVTYRVLLATEKP
jgi:malonyl-CoA O-methyltransferase